MAANGVGQAATVMARCDALADFSEEPDRLTRGYGTDALRRAQTVVATWMAAAGMTTRRDAIGNLIGRYDGIEIGASALLIGSHLDTVRDAGRYDGPLGVLIGIAAVARLNAEGRRLPFAIEVVAFADEEGLRYHSTFLGSRAFAGTFGDNELDRVDAGGISLREAIRSFGGDPGQLSSCRRYDDVLGYVEVHIEQGPILDVMNLPLGVVTAIAGQSRIAVSFSGDAGHAGTVPMDLRRDALCAAAEFVLAVENVARETAGLVATVGQLTVSPGASNVIPASAILSLDIRHADDSTRVSACRALHERAADIAFGRSVENEWTVIQGNDSVACDPGMIAGLERAVVACGLDAPRMTSGAGHDAIPMASMTPVAMLFVRCAGGVSHNPAEHVGEPDLQIAIDVLHRFLIDLQTIGPGGSQQQ